MGISKFLSLSDGEATGRALMAGRYEWSSAHVLVPLILGAVMLSGFIVWQGYAPYPMFPRRLRQDPRTLGLTLVITFISGANFFSILVSGSCN